ncbi:MAG: CobW family GTP-binding protein [Eubacteriales bacterium]
MTKIDVISGFLGAGKTTLINKLINEAYKGENLVLIENEFGEIGIDGGFLKDTGVNIKEMNSGCICCSLVGDFGRALKQVIDDYSPDRILIEPSGVGKLSDVIRAVMSADIKDASLNSYTVVADASKCKMYMKNFGEFFNDQIEHAGCIILSHTDKVSADRLSEAVALIREHNSAALMITTPISQLSASDIVATMERKTSIEDELRNMLDDVHGHHHHDDDDDDDEHECHHHHDDDDDEHECHHHHDDDDDEHECHHHHDDDDDEHECHHHHDGDDHDHGCCHHDHDHEGHAHHHHADEIFTSWGRETVRTYTEQEICDILGKLGEGKYGMILRAKGIVPTPDGKWLHFDYIPGEPDVREGSSAVTGKLCVIGSKLDEGAVAELFGVR